jgi:tRNA (mo5U34)-methyltransferase
MLNSDALLEKVAKLPWWHSIDLGDGVITLGRCQLQRWKIDNMGLPVDLRGKAVLDVGSWDGFFSFEAERRGASRVLAIDPEKIGPDSCFEFAREVLHSRVEAMEMSVYDLTPEVGFFDIVLFLGVLYHLKHPLLALERIRSVSRGILILESYHDPRLSLDFPAIAFYPGGELLGDTSNWWGPNIPAIEAMLKVVGFGEVALIAKSDDRCIFHAFVV